MTTDLEQDFPLQRALCILFSWFPVGGSGGCCGSCRACHASGACAFLFWPYRGLDVALQPFFWHRGEYQMRACWLASTAERQFCWHGRVMIAVDLLLSRNVFYGLTVWGGMTVLPSEWICRLALFCHPTALLNCREGWQGYSQ